LAALMQHLGPGYFQNDPRHGMKASRAGTRGFRAPEVLFKHPHQTCALDMWSAGVILLTMLTRRYPFFQSSDDFDAILEVASIFGNKGMGQAARLYGRKWHCTVPSVPEEHVGWRELCERLNPAFLSQVPEECFALLAGCLNLDSEQRLTARQAMAHPFIRKYGM
jgi:cell division control protein 7